MKILILGLGASGGGAEAAEYYLKLGHSVEIISPQEKADNDPAIQHLSKKGAVFIAKEEALKAAADADLVVKVPGIPIPYMIKKKAKRITNDIAALLENPKTERMKRIVIAGSKGKTSSASALSDALTRLGMRAAFSEGLGYSAFHLLSDKDLQDVRRANAHFSNDILSSLLNEPIIGQGVFWSSVDTGDGLRPYPIPIRVSSFEHVVKIRDRSKETDCVDNYVTRLKGKMREDGLIADKTKEVMDVESELMVSEISMEDMLLNRVVQAIEKNQDLVANINTRIPWGVMIQIIKEELPVDLFDRDSQACRLVQPVTRHFLGERNKDWWTTRKGPTNTLFIEKIKK